MKHGNARKGSLTAEYLAWKSMKERCLNPKQPAYKDYGGRGINIAEEWISDFGAFLSHVGRKPSPQHSLDRIDNNKGYVPGNLRWADRTTQNNNSRHVRIITVNGISLSLTKWSDRLGEPQRVIRQRIDKLGWPEEKAVNTPVQRKCK